MDGFQGSASLLPVLWRNLPNCHHYPKKSLYSWIVTIFEEQVYISSCSLRKYEHLWIYSSVQPYVSEYCNIIMALNILETMLKAMRDHNQINGDKYLLSTQSVPETFTYITLFNFIATPWAKYVLTFLFWRGGNWI